MTCFDIILETEHARQKLNTNTAEPYFLREGKSGSAIRVDMNRKLQVLMKNHTSVWRNIYNTLLIIISPNTRTIFVACYIRHTTII